MSYGAVIVDPQGVELGRPPFERVTEFDDLDGDMIYVRAGGGKIYNVVTGVVEWSAPPLSVPRGAANDNLVMYLSRTQLFVTEH
jgi:phage host-nuclease inhibitor protein Gam